MCVEYITRKKKRCDPCLLQFSVISLSLIIRVLHVKYVTILYFGFGRVLLWR